MELGVYYLSIEFTSYSAYLPLNVRVCWEADYIFLF